MTEGVAKRHESRMKHSALPPRNRFHQLLVHLIGLGGCICSLDDMSWPGETPYKMIFPMLKLQIALVKLSGSSCSHMIPYVSFSLTLFRKGVPPRLRQKSHFSATFTFELLTRKSLYQKCQFSFFQDGFNLFSWNSKLLSANNADFPNNKHRQIISKNSVCFKTFDVSYPKIILQY